MAGKGMTAAAFGAALLAGWLGVAKPGVVHHPEAEEIAPSVSAEAEAPADGPWIASCRYWIPARAGIVVAPEQQPRNEPSAVALNVDSQSTVAAGAHAESPPHSSCAAGDWAIPQTLEGSGSVPEIGSVIVTVPDPIHSHLALNFDRTVDAVLKGAAENGYLSSQYWLPWRVDARGKADAAEATGSSASSRLREQQPGLIVFRGGLYQRALYMFLVAETPVLGVNGIQLQNAFAYQRLLHIEHGLRLSAPANRPGQRDDTLSVIGPLYSGSAASLSEGIRAALKALDPREEITASIAGATGTSVAADVLAPGGGRSRYVSFGENVSYSEECFLQSLAVSGYDLSRVAVLSETGTVFGINTHPIPWAGAGRASFAGGPEANSCYPAFPLRGQGTILNIRYPRELSLLRDAQTQPPDATGPSPSPYLNLSLKDAEGDDTVPRFSRTQSPLTIEAQLMGIAHQIQRAHIQFALISASNVLDDLFLTQYLRRACPNTSIVLFSAGDLLFVRDVDSRPYIGSLSISPYLLTTFEFATRPQSLYTDYQAEAVYNATQYTFTGKDAADRLAGYVPLHQAGAARPSVPQAEREFTIPALQAPLWATTMGSDGYYPLAILNWCASNDPAILPSFTKGGITGCQSTVPAPAAKDSSTSSPPWQPVPTSLGVNSGISPSLVWMVIDGILLFLEVLHTVALWSAQLWSPLTRDLDLQHNDEPRRRSVYLNIGTSMLAAMAFITSYPLLLVGHYFHLSLGGFTLAVLTLIAAAIACASTAVKTWRYRYDRRRTEYSFFNIVAVIALLAIVVAWVEICRAGNGAGLHQSYAGLYFSYRCLQPLSGVCPLLPILLLLLAWYLWALCQTARLRFSSFHRPRIASVLPTASAWTPEQVPYPLFVPEETLERCGHPIDACLFENITCLLITRQVLRRFLTSLKSSAQGLVRRVATVCERHLNASLTVFYLALFAFCALGSHIQSLDRFLFHPVLSAMTRGRLHGPTLYELLVTSLLFPLIMIALSGWLRTILIWGSLSRSLLEPLERVPLRFAFSRFQGDNWLSMLSHSGLSVRWLDMSRSTEFIRQLAHHPYVRSKPALEAVLAARNCIVNQQIRFLMISIATQGEPKAADEPSEGDPVASTVTPSAPAPGDFCYLDGWDRPPEPADGDLNHLCAIERAYADFCSSLIALELLPYWEGQRTGDASGSKPSDRAGAPDAKPPQSAPDTDLLQSYAGADSAEMASFLALAEELIVLRYVSLIRAILVNMRFLMVFVSTAFVLAIIAWNSYPFEPGRIVDWCFTFFLATIGIGFVNVFARMHRNPILSRITDTTVNKLGIDFYFRIVTFGAIPVLTWMAYQFPDIGGTLFRLLQPGLQVVK